jgi:hypothetical protein
VIGFLAAAGALFLAGVPACLFLLNLRHYRPAPPAQDLPSEGCPSVSVLIPARNEERSIVVAVEAALASRWVDLEVLVLDDHSEDDTAALVAGIARCDGRVRLLRSPPLPTGWCGKQHACAMLARTAARPLLLFVDSDVRLAPDGLARLAAFQAASGADLVSGIPLQETGTHLEKLLIPLIHFILLGFLPLGPMRRRRHTAFAAGCGQLFLARRSSYERMGGHAVIRATLHDGLQLPRAFRAAGLRTDLCDATELARCRMYRGSGEVWRGLAKNANEGLGSPTLIGPATVLLLGGQVLPFLLLAAAPWLTPAAAILSTAAALLACLPRLAGVVCFRQSPVGALLHPLGIALLVAVQWHARLRTALRRPPVWKGRPYAAAAAGAGGML